MTFHRRWIVALLVAVCLPVAACRKAQPVANEEAQEEKSPAEIKRVNGKDGPAQITLSEEAAKRLDVQTAVVEETNVNGMTQKTVPYAALLYDIKGDTWIYANRQPEIYMREPIVVDRIDGDKVFLSQGPAAGTKVVVVAAAELYGSEQEFGEE
jgi:hypothetical protein